MTVEYRERIRRKYEELDAEKGTVEGEWRSTRMHSLGWQRSCVVERRRKEVLREAETKDGGRRRWRRQLGENREAWKMIECIKDRGEQPPNSLKHLYGQKKKAARRAVDRARRSMEEELYRQLDEDGGKKMIFNMARDRTEEGRDVKRSAVIKDNNGKLITESKEVLRILAANFKELLNGKGTASCLELPSSVRREVEVGEIGQEEVQTAMHKMKKARRQGQTKCG